jgi:hypothetical protein
MKLIQKIVIVLVLCATSFATQTVYVTTTSSSVAGYNVAQDSHGAGGAATAATATLTAAGTLIQAGTTLKWITPTIVTGLTISGTITVNIWASESVTTANAGIQVRLFKYSAGTEAGSPFATCTFGTELTTTMAAKNYTCTPTSTAFSAGDQIVIKAFFVNCATSGCPTGTMAAGTGTMDYNRSSAVDGETFVTFTETPAFANPLAATMSNIVQADLTAQFDIANAGFGPSLTTTLAQTFKSTESTTAAASTTFAAGNAVQWTISNSVATAMSAGLVQASGNAFSISPSVATSATSTLATLTNTSLSDSTSATSAFGTQWNIANSLTTSALTQFASGETTAASAASALSANNSIGWNINFSGSTALTVGNAISWTLPLSIASNLSVTQFALNGGSNASTFSPVLSASTGNVLNFATVNSSSTIPVTTGASISAFSKGVNFASIASDSIAVLPTFGSSESMIANDSTSFVSSFGSGKIAVASVVTFLTETFKTNTSALLAASTSMSAQFSVHRGGSRRRRIIVL